MDQSSSIDHHCCFVSYYLYYHIGQQGGSIVALFVGTFPYTRYSDVYIVNDYPSTTMLGWQEVR